MVLVLLSIGWMCLLYISDVISKGVRCMGFKAPCQCQAIDIPRTSEVSRELLKMLVIETILHKKASQEENNRGFIAQYEIDCCPVDYVSRKLPQLLGCQI